MRCVPENADAKKSAPAPRGEAGAHSASTQRQADGEYKWRNLGKTYVL